MGLTIGLILEEANANLRRTILSHSLRTCYTTTDAKTRYHPPSNTSTFTNSHLYPVHQLRPMEHSDIFSH